MSHLTILKLVSAFLLTLFMNLLNADTDLERNNLAKLVQEIDYLMTRVNDIQQDAPGNQRITFHYDTLKNDLNMIRVGINDHINQSIKAGRDLKPLSGQYHDHQ
ncbi:MAG: conjugal transfer protein [Gammaproteobacteria bacterium]|jgi:RAQPRD family integrative conjugative element protein|nr:conjugal transfer protein [Gammaproteobacteria bacterium]MBT7209138.1 conjugal transfer protein [Gammaproteobacteria bacterium]